MKGGIHVHATLQEQTPSLMTHITTNNYTFTASLVLRLVQYLLNCSPPRPPALDFSLSTFIGRYFSVYPK